MNGLTKKAWRGLLASLAMLAMTTAASAAAVDLTLEAPMGKANGKALVFAPDQQIGTESAAQTVKLTASGGAVTFEAIGIASSNFNMQENTCGATLADATSCTFKVKFSPEAIGTRYGELVIRSNAASSPHYVYLQGTAYGAPGAPATVSAVAGKAAATVSFSIPAANGSTITGYRVNCTPTCTPVTGAASPISVTGLTNGTSYTFTVTAIYAGGDGTPSAPSNAVTPADVPGAPTTLVARAGDTTATVSFAAPASDGGSPITLYRVRTGGVVVASAMASPITVTGLTNGQRYYFTVQAVNVVGGGPLSAVSNAVTPAPATVPGAPTGVTAAAGNTSATVSFTAPVSNGGSVITGYKVSCTPTCTVASGSASPVTVTGLTNGTSYTFKVVATNAIGDGPASVASNAVVPGALPDAPTAVSAVAGNGEATVSFTAPASNGGTAITGYKVKSGGSVVATGASSPIKVTGLTNGTAYTFTVAATNAVGDGPDSAASMPVTPSTTGDLCAANGLVRKTDVTAMDWGIGGRVDNLNLKNNEAYVLSWTAPATLTTYRQILSLYSGATKLITISKDVCGFDTPLNASAKCSVQQDPALLTEEAGPRYTLTTSTYYCQVTAGETYYVNIRNAKPTRPIEGSCTNPDGCTFSLTY